MKVVRKVEMVVLFLGFISFLVALQAESACNSASGSYVITLEKCATAWEPKGGSEDNTTSIRAYVSQGSVQGSFKFTLYDTSDEKGYCLNCPASIPSSGEDSDAWKDLQFQDSQAGFTITGGNKDVAETTGTSLSEATVTIKSYDYGAYGKIKVEFQPNDGSPTCVGVEAGSSRKYTNIPLDSDNNHIHDGWQYNSGSSTDDKDKSPDNTNDGDGLQRYEEYRGVDINNDNIISSSERLNPSKKDLFVKGDGFGGSFPVFAYGDAFKNADINVHTFVGPTTKQRGIDVLIVSVLDQGGHIQRLGVRSWGWSTLGQSYVGTSTVYGNAQINKRAINYYYSDKPYKDGSAWTAVMTWNDPPNGRFDVYTRVEDANDNGTLDANECDGNSSSPPDDGDSDLDGDYIVSSGSSWDWNQDLNPLDVDDDGEVELPAACGISIPSGVVEYTKDHMVLHVVTHEIGHALGINGPYNNGHCNDSTCVMYQRNDDRDRQDHLCSDCRAMVKIHNN